MRQTQQEIRKLSLKELRKEAAENLKYGNMVEYRKLYAELKERMKTEIITK